MLRALSIMRSSFRVLACALLVTLSSAPTSLAAIDLSLNVLYANPANPASGGIWQLVAKTDGSGLAGLSALVTNIDTAQNAAPRGTVNGSNAAGFGFLTNTDGPGGSRNLTLGQVPTLSGEQSAFYGVGTLTNGAPNYPGQPPGTNSIGPAFTTLTNVMGVPWPTLNTFNDPAWATAATLATGAFAVGVTPGFFSNGPDTSRGTTFLGVGTSMAFGAVSAPTVATTIVRTNFVSNPGNGDYNHNGIVDAADYSVWRNTFGLSTPLDADGNANGVIDEGDYTVWKMKFGTVIGAGTALGSATVPEPAAATLLALGAALALGGARRRSRDLATVGNPRPARVRHGLQRAERGRFRNTPIVVSFNPDSSQLVAHRRRTHINFPRIYSRFWQLLNSSEKRLIEGGNCLTASKTGNIMPKGSRTAGVSTS